MLIRKIIFAILLSGLGITTGNAAEGMKLAACEAFPPFTYAEEVNGKLDISRPTGFVSEIIDEIFSQNDELKIKSFKIYPWKNGLNGTFEGKYDAIMPTIENSERSKKLYFPKEHISSGVYKLFILKENAGKLKYDSFDDLKGHKVGMLRGLAIPDDLKAANKKDKFLKEAKNAKINLKMLEDGKIDYFMEDYLVAMETINKLGLSDKVIALEKPVYIVKHFVAFSKKSVDKDDVDKFDAALTSFKKTDKYKSLKEKYDIPDEK